MMSRILIKCLSLVKIFYLKIRFYKYFKHNGLSYYFEKRANIQLLRRGKLFLGKTVHFGTDTSIQCRGGNISIGTDVFFNENCRVISYGNIEIGDYCIFGPNVMIYDHNHRYSERDKLIKYQGYTIEPVVIGSDVWVAANVVITAGVKIGNHVVVGANSVVTRNLSDNGIYGGNPARLLKEI